jgi:ABC-type transport system involved in multi-copper enzyme maturation permease subunit
METGMGETMPRARSPELLNYRPWTGTFRGPWASVWPIGRIALGMLFRRRLFWGLYALSLLIFLLFFFGQYLLAYAEVQAAPTAKGQFNPRDVVGMMRGFLELDGSGKTYRTFMEYQGYMVMIVLAQAGSILVGNDLRFGSLPYYLSKPLSRRHYLLGKGLAVAVFVNMMTTIPAIVLFVQYGLLDSWRYFYERGYLLVGILGYGAVLTVCLSLLLLSSAMWLRQTVPLVMMWTTLFLFCRLLGRALVVGLRFNPRWRLIDLWNDMYLIGSWCLRMEPSQPQFQPALHDVAFILGGVTLTCLMYLVMRIRAVEIVK